MRRPRLFTRTLLFMVLIFGVIATATSLISGWQLHHLLTTEYESKALALGRSMADSDLELILDKDAAAVQSRIDQYLEIKGVSYVLVCDDMGRVIAHTFTPIIPAEVDRLLTPSLEEDARNGHVIENLHLAGAGDFIHVIQPILSGLAGYVHIGMDRGLIRGFIRSAIIRQQVMTLMVFLTSVIGAYAFISNISRPLRRLTDYAKRVAAHDFTARVDIRSKDEIGQLAEAMQSMSVDLTQLISGLEERVAQATGELQQAKDELERKVAERTGELSRANIQLKIEIAERKVVGEALKKTEEKYRTIFENAVEGIFQVSMDGYYISANPALAHIYGYDTPAEFMSAVNATDSRFHLDEEQREHFFRKVEELSEVKGFESQIRRRDGRVVWISENARRVVDSKNETLYYEGSVEDITLRKEAEEQLLHQAFHDPLTSLPNRVLFLDHLQMALQRSKRREKYMFAVLYLDLDRFKIINDSLGHDAGDALLMAVARVLEKCARGMDTVARFGGDEFAILLEEIAAPRDAIKIARRILDEMVEPFELGGSEVFTSCSIGIVLHTREYTRPEQLLRDADTAMYRAKELGKSRFKVFNQRMHEQALMLMELETDLRKAVDQTEFHIVFQPIVSLEEGVIAGFEALVRWDHPEQGLIMPDAFIPLAEDTGLIYGIDYRVLEQASERITRWVETYPDSFFAADPPMTLNLNISGKHFRQPALVGQMEQMLKKSGINPRSIILEITEHALMDHPVTAGEILGKLKNLGIGLSIDDFGTGYSSLSYLQRFPIDVVKIDRSFVAAVRDDRDSQTIVKTIVSLGLSLGLKVVAEGVETKEQLEFLRQSGCQYAQGYYFSKPVTEDKVDEMLRAGARLDSLVCEC